MKRQNRKFNIVFLFFALFLFLASFTRIQHDHYKPEAGEPQDTTGIHNENDHRTEHKSEFDPGSFIFGHILDDYEWHICTINEAHISIPLPIILYSISEENKGLHVFCSSMFHHGHKDYKGFKIESSGPNKGKIVETLGDESMQTNLNAALPLDFTITKNVLEIFITLALMLWLFISMAKAYNKRENCSPKGKQLFIEPIILFIRDDIGKPAIGEHKYERFMPFLLSVFFFIFLNNLIGLVPLFPGGANVTGNITVTMALALFTFILTTIKGNKNYWQHIFNAPGVPWWLKVPIPLMPLIELIGVFTKPFVLMVRLFANISAGHIIAMGFFSLIFIFGAKNAFAGYGISILSITFTIFMTLLELLVAFIQAYVFTLLSAIYFGMATEEDH